MRDMDKEWTEPELPEDAHQAGEAGPNDTLVGQATEAMSPLVAPGRSETQRLDDESGLPPQKGGALLDIELEARIQFGSREMPLSKLLELSSGDVLELDRLITDPVDLLVGDRIVARGEVVVVGGNFALQILEVMQPKPRLESVRCLL